MLIPAYLANGVGTLVIMVIKFLPDNPKISPEEQELRILRKRLRDAELERDILKKAIAIFSKGDGPYTGS